jgi:hypothetical protein
VLSIGLATGRGLAGPVVEGESGGSSHPPWERSILSLLEGTNWAFIQCDGNNIRCDQLILTRSLRPQQSDPDAL